jgi:hypothetical protein
MLDLSNSQLLLANGANPVTRDLHGQTALDVIPPLPETARSLVPINEIEAKHQYIARKERSELRKLLSSQHQAREPDSRSAQTSTVDCTRGRTLPAATVRLERPQQRALAQHMKIKEADERLPLFD